MNLRTRRADGKVFGEPQATRGFLTVRRPPPLTPDPSAVRGSAVWRRVTRLPHEGGPGPRGEPATEKRRGSHTKRVRGGPVGSSHPMRRGARQNSAPLVIESARPPGTRRQRPEHGDARGWRGQRRRAELPCEIGSRTRTPTRAPHAAPHWKSEPEPRGEKN